jgi:hypothetical protein
LVDFASGQHRRSSRARTLAIHAYRAKAALAHEDSAVPKRRNSDHLSYH